MEDESLESLVPGSLADRCVSLVQSIAKFQGDMNELPVAWFDEADEIARDAGWGRYAEYHR